MHFLKNSISFMFFTSLLKGVKILKKLTKKILDDFVAEMKSAQKSISIIEIEEMFSEKPLNIKENFLPFPM